MNRRELSICSPARAKWALRGAVRVARGRNDGGMGRVTPYRIGGMLPGIRRPVFRCRPCRRTTKTPIVWNCRNPAIGLSRLGGDAGKIPLKPADIGSQDLVLAWAFDPQKKLLRDGSRLNMVLLMRFDPATLADAARQSAPDGVVAYSAICTHQQCWVTDWLKSAQVLQCPCHQSRYDLRHAAKVVGGPAPRPLPALAAEAERRRAGRRRSIHRSRRR